MAFIRFNYKINYIMKTYSKQDIIDRCKLQSSGDNFKSFYNNGMVNYRGKTQDTKEFYTEVIAKYLLDNYDDLFRKGRIPMVPRKSSYKQNTHDGNQTYTNRKEENLAKYLFNQLPGKEKHLEYIGQIIDYQVPLKNSQKDEKVGKIDLLSVNSDDIFILELKCEGTDETMLRCVLEAYTYLQQLDKEKLVKDFGLNTSEPKFHATPLVFKNSYPYQEYMNKEDHPYLITLMDKLGIKPYFLVPTYDCCAEID